MNTESTKKKLPFLDKNSEGKSYGERDCVDKSLICSFFFVLSWSCCKQLLSKAALLDPWRWQYWQWQPHRHQNTEKICLSAQKCEIKMKHGPTVVPLERGALQAAEALSQAAQLSLCGQGALQPFTPGLAGLPRLYPPPREKVLEHPEKTN